MTAVVIVLIILTGLGLYGLLRNGHLGYGSATTATLPSSQFFTQPARPSRRA